jgi:rubredoxin
MRRQYPNAVQCPQCRAGPVVAEGCYDLSAHNGERTRGGRISNACPSCGFFSRDRNHWHRWDGQMRQALH